MLGRSSRRDFVSHVIHHWLFPHSLEHQIGSNEYSRPCLLCSDYWRTSTIHSSIHNPSRSCPSADPLLVEMICHPNTLTSLTVSTQTPIRLSSIMSQSRSSSQSVCSRRGFLILSSPLLLSRNLGLHPLATPKQARRDSEKADLGNGMRF